MSLAKSALFNWEEKIGKSAGRALEGLLKMKAKSTELSMKTDKFVKPREPIDFAAYKSKLVLTKSGFDFLEKLYKEDKIPRFHAQIPALTLQKRAASASVLAEIAIHAKEDIELIKVEIEEFQPKRITMETTYGQLCQHYPHFARQVEAEIHMNLWCYNYDPNTLDPR